MEVYQELKAKLFSGSGIPEVEFQEWTRETLKLMERTGPEAPG